MKICYVFSNFYLEQITGQPAIVLKLARYAAERGKDVYVISNTCKGKSIPQDRIKYFLIKGLGNFRTYFFNIVGIVKYLRKIKPDLIHVHGQLLIIFIWFIAKLLRINLICSICETLDVVNSFYRKILIFCLRDSKRVFVTAEYISKQLLKGGILPDRITLVRIGLDKKFLVDLDDSNPDTDILFYGDSKKARGFDIIFRLARQLPDLRFKILLRWEGKDSYDELEQIRRMPNVIIKNYPYGSSLEQIISKAKLIVLPWRRIGVRPPLSLVESMASGKSVLTSFIAGNEELIQNGYNGLLLDFNKHDEVKAKISFLINNEQTRKRIGQRAKQTISRMYSPEEYDKVLNYYSNIAAKRMDKC